MSSDRGAPLIKADAKATVRRFYDSVGWSSADGSIFQNARFEDLRPVVAEYVHRCHLRVARYVDQVGRLFLDAGSGPVQWDEYASYSEAYEHRICLDISITALRAARSRLGGHALPVVGDIANLPFLANAFDAIISLHAIHHLPQNEHRTAFIELNRVLAPGRRAVVVNGWYRPMLMRLVAPLIAVARFTAGRGVKQDVDWSAVATARSTFVAKMSPAGLARELKGQVVYRLYPWRSLSSQFMRWFIRPGLGGKLVLRLVYWLEEQFPDFFARNGQYPIIEIKKPAAVGWALPRN